MARRDFWRPEWFLGLVGASVVLDLARSVPIRSLERVASNLGVRGSRRRPSDRIAVIAIDDVSIAQMGCWLWSREVRATLIDGLAAAMAKALGYRAFLSEPQLAPDLPAFMRNNASQVTGDAAIAPDAAQHLGTPVLQEVDSQAAAIGHPNSSPNVDLAIRNEPLVLGYFVQFYSFLSLRLAGKQFDGQSNLFSVGVMDMAV